MIPGVVSILALAGLGTLAHAAAAGDQPAGCTSAQPAGAVAFHGGTTSGEEITVLFDADAATYRITIDASRVATRRGLVREGSLLRGERDCAYLLSGEDAGYGPAPVALSARGVLFGRIAGTEPGAAPAAFIAFRHTSNRMADLAGRWHVSGREYAIDTALRSRPIADYELRIRADGNIETCPSRTQAGHGRCKAGGRFSSDGRAFRLNAAPPGTAAPGAAAPGAAAPAAAAGDTTLILGKVGDDFVPILLKRDAASQGLRIFTARRDGAR